MMMRTIGTKTVMVMLGVWNGARLLLEARSAVAVETQAPANSWNLVCPVVKESRPAQCDSAAEAVTENMVASHLTWLAALETEEACFDKNPVLAYEAVVPAVSAEAAMGLLRRSMTDSC
jgi:hypothetical protein